MVCVADGLVVPEAVGVIESVRDSEAVCVADAVNV